MMLKYIRILNFYSVIDFIEDVIKSFAHHALPSQILAIKYHPLDRGYSDYSGLIAMLTGKCRLQGRCLYIHDQHLPTLIKHARGVVVINSTAGLSALLHGAPTKVCGNALYDIQGVAFQGTLDGFWKKARLSKPDQRLLKGFGNYLV